MHFGHASNSKVAKRMASEVREIRYSGLLFDWSESDEIRLQSLFLEDLFLAENHVLDEQKYCIDQFNTKSCILNRWISIFNQTLSFVCVWLPFVHHTNQKSIHQNIRWEKRRDKIYRALYIPSRYCSHRTIFYFKIDLYIFPLCYLKIWIHIFEKWLFVRITRHLSLFLCWSHIWYWFE